MSASSSRVVARRSMNLSAQQRLLSLAMKAVMAGMCLYCLVPVFWLLFSSTKTATGLYASFGLWFADSDSGGIALWENLVGTFTAQNGIFGRWLANTAFYAVSAGLGATVIATLAGYAIATMRFPGRGLVLNVSLAFMTIPATVVSVPLFLMYAKVGLVNTAAAVIVPQLASPFGVYLMIIYARSAIPSSLLESAKLDGASQWRTFRSIGMPLLAPAFVTVLLFSLVGAWNNYLLPLIMLTSQEKFPLTVGLNQWLKLSSDSSYAGVESGSITSFIITGSLITIIPLMISFLCLQRYWQSGLAAGSVKQ